jgi:hypothetical protein
MKAYSLNRRVAKIEWATFFFFIVINIVTPIRTPTSKTLLARTCNKEKSAQFYFCNSSIEKILFHEILPY